MLSRTCRIVCLILPLLTTILGDNMPALAADATATAPAVQVDPLNATWHIGLTELWPSGAKPQNRALDIYQVFDNGRPVNALGSARFFNKSMHFVRRADLVMDIPGLKLTGTMVVLITPDAWVPRDGQPFELTVDLKGELAQEAGQWRLRGTYAARRTDGQPMREDARAVEGKLGGGGGPTETGWDNAVWRVQLTQVRTPGGVDKDTLDITLGIANGKVQWGLIGVTPEPNWPATKRYPFDIRGFQLLSNAGIATGSAVLTARHIHPGGDPKQLVRIDVTARRVQGLAGGEAALTVLDGGKPAGAPTQAFGRGLVSKGGGQTQPTGLWIHERDDRPWWTPVEGHKPVAPGEHPRLLFRADDLPALRKRAETPEGKAILARLRKLLDGRNGDTLPTRFSATPPANGRTAPPLPIGAFTSFHGAGYGFLYQITGEKKYAELARQSIELMFDGKYDIDNRYSWVMPGTDLRCGTVLAAVAYAYDFCYDAWAEDFRRKVALEIQNYNKLTATPDQGQITLAYLTGRANFPPGSNHYGSLIGGTGVALLAILGDPGVDSATLEARLAETEMNIPRMLELGFGDGGWFAEGLGSSSGLSRLPMTQLLCAERHARGRDYLDSRPNAQWMNLMWIMHLGGSGWGSIPNRGVYEGDTPAFRDAEMCVAFGGLEAKYQPAMLWSYQTFVGSREPKDKLECGPDEQSWGAQRYPYGAVYSFINWPMGIEPKNPATVLPLAAVDRIHGYFVARNRWQDSDDIIVTHWLEYGPPGTTPQST
jgi:hypothetical protein